MEFSVKTDKKSLAMDLLSINIILIYKDLTLSKGNERFQKFIDFVCNILNSINICFVKFKWNRIKLNYSMLIGIHRYILKQSGTKDI